MMEQGLFHNNATRCVPSFAMISDATFSGLPTAPNWIRTFTISMGWMMVVAIIPDKPPFTKGLAVAQAVFFCSAIASYRYAVRESEMTAECTPLNATEQL
jgi:hypothetical protein